MSSNGPLGVEPLAKSLIDIDGGQGQSINPICWFCRAGLVQVSGCLEVAVQQLKENKNKIYVDWRYKNHCKDQ